MRKLKKMVRREIGVKKGFKMRNIFGRVFFENN
jgi:hypothetical protein